MNRAVELFYKILVDGQEIDLQTLDTNSGIYSAGSQNSQKTLKVDFVLKNKNEIPAKIFSGLSYLKSVVVPESVTTVGARAFENTGAEITGLEQVKTYGEGALVGTYMSYMSYEFISYIQEHNPEAFIERYTELEAIAYNSYLPGALQYGAVKTPASHTDAIAYTDAEVDEFNANIDGAVKIGDPSEDIYINDYQNIEYIVDQQSWENSFNNGCIMAKYYETYPDNDLIASDGSNKTATFNDRIYLGTITGEENEKRFKAGWSDKSQSITNESDPSEVYYIKRLDEESPYYGTADEWKAQYDKFHGMSWQLYSDALLTTPIEDKEIYIRTLVFDGFTHTYGGMIANGGKLPWIGAWFTQDFAEEAGVHMIFKYEGKDDVRPWGDRVFGKGENQKVWGFASVSDEFNDNALAIQDCGGEGTFDQSKFSLVLEKTIFNTYDKEGANAVNAQIEGALQYDSIKIPAIDTPAELYTNEEVDALNAQLPGAVHTGDVKPNYV